MEKVCILDIESSYAPERKDCKIFIVGVKVFEKRINNFQSLGYKTFRNQELEELIEFLSDFDGLIIGHNILGFDYAVISNYIGIPITVIEKTVDTLLLLKRVNPNGFRGLSLQNLSIENLGQRKTEIKKSVPKLWKSGQENEVIRYNEQDCNLTFRLWRYLNENDFVSGRYYDLNFSIKLQEEELKVLQGKSKFYREKDFGFIKSNFLYDFFNQPIPHRLRWGT